MKVANVSDIILCVGDSLLLIILLKNFMSILRWVLILMPKPLVLIEIMNKKYGYKIKEKSDPAERGLGNIFNYKYEYTWFRHHWIH